VLYLGQMVAQVKRSDVTNNQVVELITTGRSGEHGLSGNGSYAEPATAATTPTTDQEA